MGARKRGICTPALLCCIVWKNVIQPLSDNAAPDTCVRDDTSAINTEALKDAEPF